MKAILCHEPGPPELLTLEELPPPRPGDDEAVVAVKAVALNFSDTLIIRDQYQYRPSRPFSPGAEIAGVVTQCGAKVQDFRVGDRVMAYIVWGGARQAVAVKAQSLVRLPDEVDFAPAACLSVTYGTTLYALRDRAALKSGETLAVLGAAGGVGQAAIEIGKLSGARVIACASDDKRLRFCRRLGADETVNYRRDDLKRALKSLTQGRGVDVVYDPVGGGLSEPALRAMAWNGRFLTIGFASGEIPRLPLNLVLLKSCQVVGVFWGAHVAREPARHRANMAMLLDWCAHAKITPHIHAVYPLEEAAPALTMLAKGQVRGKLVLAP